MRVFVLVIGLLCGLAGDAAAQQANNRGQASRWCIGPRGVSQAQMLAGCTWLIENGPGPGGNLLTAHRTRGLLLAQALRPKSALPDLDAALRLAPDDAQITITRGLVLAMLGRALEAVAVFDAFLALRPDSATLLVMRAAALSEARQLDAAMADVTAAMRLAPDDHSLLGHRSIILIRMGERHAGQRDLDRMLAFEPGNEEALMNRASNRLALGDFAGAVSDARVALGRGASRAQTLATRCVARWRMNDAGSRGDCDAAIGAARGDEIGVWPFTARAGIALAEGRVAAAMTDLDEGIARPPHDGLAFWLRGLAKTRQGQDGSADFAAGLAREPLARVRAREFFGDAIGELPP